MAPYVMKVEIVNLTDYRVAWIGESTLKDLDGKTDVKGMTLVSGQRMSTDISKSGGTDGLFTTLSWKLPSWTVDYRGTYKTQFSVYSEMPASSWGKVFVGLRDINGMSEQQFMTSDATDANEKAPKHWFTNSFTVEGITVSLETLKLEYPHSHVRVTVIQNWNASEMPSKMKIFEGKRIRSPDGRLSLVLGGQLRYITDMGTYGSMFSDFNFCNLPQAMADAMPKGAALSVNPALISDGSAIFLVDDGKRRWIQDPPTFNHYGFDWGKVANTDVGKYEQGSNIKV